MGNFEKQAKRKKTGGGRSGRSWVRQHILCVWRKECEAGWGGRALCSVGSFTPGTSPVLGTCQFLRLSLFLNWAVKLSKKSQATVLNEFSTSSHYLTADGVHCMANPRRRQWHPLQYPCLENPMDVGAWWAVVHGVAKSWTRLSDFTFTFHFHALEKEMATHSSVLAWRIPGMGEPGGLPSMELHRIGHNWSDLAAAAWQILFLKKKKNCFPGNSSPSLYLTFTSLSLTGSLPILSGLKQELLQHLSFLSQFPMSSPSSFFLQYSKFYWSLKVQFTWYPSSLFCFHPTYAF